MRCKYQDRDLGQRLDQSIVRYKGHPYYVRHIDVNILSLYEVDGHRKDPILNIRSDDGYLDISTVPLGYFQLMPNIVVHATRVPSRQFKQGIHESILKMESIPKSIEARNFRWTIYCTGFKNMILGRYPTALEALATFRRWTNSSNCEIAIHKDVALEFVPEMGITNVYYKNENPPCGWIPKNSRTVVVPNSEKAWIISMYLEHFGLEIE